MESAARCHWDCGIRSNRSLDYGTAHLESAAGWERYDIPVERYAGGRSMDRNPVGRDERSSLAGPVVPCARTHDTGAAVILKENFHREDGEGGETEFGVYHGGHGEF